MKKTKKLQGYLLALLLLFPILAPLQAEPVGDGSTNLLEAAAGRVKETRKKERKPLPELPFKAFYLDVAVGYGFNVGNVNLQSNYGYCSPAAPCNPFRGLSVNLGFGYRFNPYLAIEIGGRYMVVTNTNVADSWYSESFHDTLIWQNFYEHWDTRHIQEMQGGQLSLQLVASPGFSRWDPYVKAGLGFLISSYQAEQEVSTNGVASNPLQYRALYRYPKRTVFRLGFTSALGLNCHLTKYLSLFAEWQFCVYTPSRISWIDEDTPVETSGNKDEIEELGINTERRIFRDNVSFNNHGLNIGLKFKF